MTQRARWLLAFSLALVEPTLADGAPTSADAPASVGASQGIWQGGGRACHGTLNISARRLRG